MVAKGKEFLLDRVFSLKAVSCERPNRTASSNITTAVDMQDEQPTSMVGTK
jgi:hypothetical protein